ncbi:MAG: hypothetical protein GWO08_16665, partial [Gammaproteobacteria bacterium]|nr:hypothetical protein [Gammaproteobacteria bacterium]NIW45472.1 hypothetical protein [Gammaproteobacteria bacterium]NIX57237.1 hypothetical protein [candidate division Zixibacteria bacterium]
GNPNQSAYLVSPPLDLTALSAPSLSFWYHMFGDDMGELHVDVWDGSIWNMDIIPPIVGNQGDMWFKQIASLTAFSGTINIRFRGITGSGFESDMAVDDVLVDEAQPDLAVTQFIGFPAFAPGSSTVNFDVEVSNVGATPTPGTILDISLNGSPSSSHSVSALTSGQSDTISTSITTSASGTDIVTAALQAIP